MILEKLPRWKNGLSEEFSSDDLVTVNRVESMDLLRIMAFGEFAEHFALVG